jgi:hypothetical protein
VPNITPFIVTDSRTSNFEKIWRIITESVSAETDRQTAKNVSKKTMWNTYKLLSHMLKWRKPL